MDFVYDNTGKPYALNYDGTMYYYVLNLQGDVIAIVTTWGAVYGTYTYDAWGNVISQSGSIASINPIRYRGYYYDSETGLYYLGSRYYDPAVKRFINADGAALAAIGSYNNGLTIRTILHIAMMRQSIVVMTAEIFLPLLLVRLLAEF